MRSPKKPKAVADCLLQNKLREIFDDLNRTVSWSYIDITSVHDRNIFDDTPLHTVCLWGDIEAVKLLIEAGADVNAPGDHGATPIFYAIMAENIELVSLLLKKGASKKAMIFGDTSVYNYARHKRNKKLLDLLA